MNLWIDIAGAAQASLFAAVTFTRSVFSRMETGEAGPDLHRLARHAGRRARAAFRRAHREEKVALLGLVLVLAFLTWP